MSNVKGMYSDYLWKRISAAYASESDTALRNSGFSFIPSRKPSPPYGPEAVPVVDPVVEVQRQLAMP